MNNITGCAYSVELNLDLMVSTLDATYLLPYAYFENKFAELDKQLRERITEAGDDPDTYVMIRDTPFSVKLVLYARKKEEGA